MYIFEDFFVYYQVEDFYYFWKPADLASSRWISDYKHPSLPPMGYARQPSCHRHEDRMWSEEDKNPSAP